LVGSCEMAVSASRARFCIQFLFCVEVVFKTFLEEGRIAVGKSDVCIGSLFTVIQFVH